MLVRPTGGDTHWLKSYGDKTGSRCVGPPPPRHTEAAHSHLTVLDGSLWKRDCDPGWQDCALYDQASSSAWSCNQRRFYNSTRMWQNFGFCPTCQLSIHSQVITSVVRDRFQALWLIGLFHALGYSQFPWSLQEANFFSLAPQGNCLQ